MPDKKPKIFYDLNGFPVYDSKDYPDHGEFQAAALNDMETRQAKSTPNSDKTDFYNKAGRYAPAVLPAVGSTIGDVGGPIGSAAGAGIGSLLARQVLQRISPQNFGNPPSGPIEGAATTGLDVAGNAVVPAIVRGALSKGISGVVADALLTKLGGASVLKKLGLSNLVDLLTPSSKPLSKLGQTAVDTSRAAGSTVGIQPEQ